MTRLLSIICGMLALAGGEAAAQLPVQQNVPHHPSRRPRPQRPSDPNNNPDQAVSQPAPAFTPQQFPAQPRASAPQPTPTPPPMETPAPAAQAPENLPPPTPAQVTYHDGLLTVQAMNSTLGGLLSAIHNKTGIQFEGLEGGASERIAISMGPAPEGEVLAAILGGSNFDYVVLGREDSPGIVQRVVLTPRGGATQTVAAGQPQRPANADGEGDDEDAPEEQASSGDPEPQDTPARAPVTQVQQPQQPQQPQQTPNQTPPTPDQLMQRLVQMQQQQQVQQQQLQQQQQQPQTPQNQAPIKPPTIPQ